MKPPGANSTLALSPVAENISTSAPHPPPSSAALCTQETHERLCYERVYLFTVGRVILCTVKISSMLRFQRIFALVTLNILYTLAGACGQCMRRAWAVRRGDVCPSTYFRLFGHLDLSN